MPDLDTMLKGLPDVLAEMVEKLGPGASVAVLFDGEVYEAAVGLLNLNTGVEVTTDTLFQIGSITKVFTGTLIMQLVDSGDVDLDAAVREYVPEFRVADAEATEAITVRQLLTHSSGFDGGDHFLDTGRGDDAVARYVDGLSDLEQISAPGARYSYNNAGYTVLGRIIEVITGRVYDTALRERLLLPAGLERSFTLAEDALLHRAAAGHVMADGQPRLVTQWGMDRSTAPAGAICAAAADVVGFAQLHLDEGRGPDGTQVLSAASVRAMQQPQIAYTGSDEISMGLSWLLGTHEGLRTVSHNGGTLGQNAFLHVFPERRFAISCLTNGPGAPAIWQAVSAHVLDQVLGLPPMKPRVPALPDTGPDIDLASYVGKYVRRAVHITVSQEEGGELTGQIEYVNTPYDLTAPPPFPLKPVDAQTFVAMIGGQPSIPMQFFDFDDAGRPALLFASRLARREQ